MNEFLVQGSLPLDEGGLLVIDDGREMLVYVWQGMVWVTQEGLHADRVLKGGDWMRIERGGRTVISALAPSALALTSPYEEHQAAYIGHAAARAAEVATLYRGRPNSVTALLNRAARVWASLTAPAGQLASA
jgi:hypothetical protein